MGTIFFREGKQESILMSEDGFSNINRRVQKEVGMSLVHKNTYEFE
jgi:hypothetical protein